MAWFSFRRHVESLPQTSQNRLIKRFPIIRFLSDQDGQNLFSLTSQFLAKKQFIAAPEVSLSQSHCEEIALLCCLPIIHIGLKSLHDWRSIIVVAESQQVTNIETDDSGVAHEWDDEISGEVLPLGPIVLSLADVTLSGWGRGYNVVIHEIAHKLDALEGLSSAPNLPEGEADRWVAVFEAAWKAFAASLRQPRYRRALVKGDRTLNRLPLDDYAAESPAEFFAVCCEEFFERPLHLSRHFPAVFELLVGYFRLDPRQNNR